MTRILVLDDELLISLMLQDWLVELGCETIGPACSVTGALNLISRETPDAALLEVSVRDAASYAVAAALRDRRIPFALATGRTVDSVPTIFKDELILAKPFSFDAARGHCCQTARR